MDDQNEDDTHRGQEPTITDLLFQTGIPWVQKELEAFRLEYEADAGPTDLTRYYTSMWPTEQVDALKRTDFSAYMRGLPMFVQAFFDIKFLSMAKEGRLDQLEDDFLSYYVQRRSKELSQAFDQNEGDYPSAPSP